jgi:CubicO group peptidase (beta-lactamase class C family)
MTRLPAYDRPEEGGFDSGRLQRLRDHMAGMVEQGRIAGGSTLLMRRGRIVRFDTFGGRRLGDPEPLARDALFRIYSMTKPVASVAAMILFEEGRWTLDDPITRFLPEFSDLKVCVDFDSGGGMRLEDAVRPPTMRELMSHTSGFGYGLFDHHPVERAYKEEGVLTAGSLDELARRAAALPLMFQPGGEWFYSVATDLLGLVVERISGRSFGDFLRERVFEPLGMRDTGFHVPAKDLPRACILYADDGAGGLRPATETFGVPVSDLSRPPPCEGGGGGLISTAPDYARFCQMILNGGALDGVRVLAPATVRLMATNMIPEPVLQRSHPLRLVPFNPAFGFGLGFSLMKDPARMGSLEGRGTLAWGGSGGTWFWIDPEHDVVFVGMIQRVADPVSDEFRRKARVLTYQALTGVRAFEGVP